MAHPALPTLRASVRHRARLVPLLLAVAATAVVAPVTATRAATESAYATAVRADAPSGWWRLGDTAGTCAVDATGARDGTYRNGTSLGRAGLLAGDPANPAAWFDGTDDDVRVTSTAALSPSAAVTVEAWIRADALPPAGSFASLVTKRESYALQFNGPRLELTIMQAGVRRRLQAAAGAIATGRTYHVVGTFGAGVQRLYVDGRQVASASLAGAITTNANELTIGSWGGTKERFRGTIDEAAVYARALSATRVAAHASAGRTAPPVPTPTPVPTPAPTATPVPTATAAPTPTATPVPSVAPSVVPSVVPSPTPAPSATPTPRPAGTPAPSPTATPTPAPTASPAPALRTGLALHFMWQTLAETNADLDRMQAAGMTYARFDVSWRNSEPAKGTYQYLDKLDQVIAAVRAHGMSLTITVIETPGWANANAGMFAPPTSMADYASFLGVLAKRYAATPGMVWEVWNEENDPHFWTTGPSATQYASMLRAAYAAVKANDPDATVITGGILFNNTAFLEGLYTAGAGSSFDGLGIHPYSINRAPGDTSSAYYSYRTSVPQFQAVLSSHGQSAKPIWVTEFGWSTANVTDATRATWLADAVTIARGWTNVRGLGAYTLHQSQFPEYGLLTSSGAATASWTAYVAAQ